MNRKIISRQKEVKLRKNFLPTFLITIFLWFGVFSIVHWVDPFSKGALPMLFTNIFFAVFFTFSIIFANTRRGLLSTGVFSIYLLLRYFELGSLINLTLLIGIAITTDFYILRKNR